MARPASAARLPLAAAAFALLAGAPPSVRADEKAPADASAVFDVAAMGDSLTDARSGGGKYLAALRKRCPESRFVSYGKGGEMVNQMRRRFARALYERPAGPPRYTHVIVFGGVNDLYSDLTAHRTVAKIETDLAEMYRVAREHGAKVVALTVSPWGGFKHYNERRGASTRELNSWILAGREAGVVDHAVDTTQLLGCGDEGKLCERFARPYKDGLHFGPEGHEVLGEALFKEAFSNCR